MLEISKMLTLSTAHIAGPTMVRLCSAFPNFENIEVYRKDDVGAYIYFHTDEYNKLTCSNKGSSGTLTDDLYKCIVLAHELGCNMLCLDQDGPTTVLLETYDW